MFIIKIPGLLKLNTVEVNLNLFLPKSGLLNESLVIGEKPLPYSLFDTIVGIKPP